MLSKLNFVILWCIHILIYFCVLTIALYVLDYNNPEGIFHKPVLLMILKSPLVGLYGLLDGIGFLVFISIAIMILINLYLKKAYLSYLLSLALTYPFFIYYCNEGYGSYKLTLLSLLITVVLNGIILRKLFFKSKNS